MYSQASTATTMASDNVQSDSRLTVADILSSMANGEAITPTTFASLEGFSTGVLTQTTPTLTPTTLRNIEQTFFELQSVPPQQVQHHNQAGFVPPIVNPVHTAAQQSVISNGGGAQPSSACLSPGPSSSSSTSYHQPLSVKSTSSGSSSVTSGSSPPWTGGGYQPQQPVTQTKTRKSGSGRMGGRRPTRNEKLSPEEEERRRVRRERNKLAAARCRKRRLDHTNMLVYETDGLEDKRQSLQMEIQELQSQKEELEFILEAHKVACKLQKRGHGHGGGHSGHHHDDPTTDVKPVLSELNSRMNVPSASSAHSASSNSSSSSSTTTTTTTTSLGSLKRMPYISQQHKPVQRPNSLALASTFVAPHPPSMVPSSTASTVNNSSSTGRLSITEATGIVISTPSNGIFNFDALMEGGTGLTPVSSGTGLLPVIPTCSTQQRASSSDLSSPDTITPPKLVSL